ncbi:hypothetical protein EDD18DRAFT_239528 [Armillaria luteobubalina]|uniref:T6SS Phospholipase effector Tle1-like catalytic domain-containing protein n=1 Tax=Armillaria luteobubalina TaxID=153913 RepID=A0AA39NYY5_9AGAR|nr:hypothetical protein EDD18DRAFT_239528 [Armillaria luteobubalina]
MTMTIVAPPLHECGITSLSTAETIVGDVERTFLIPELGADIPQTTVPADASASRKHPVKEETLDPNTTSEFVPPDHKHRTLVLCFDGTGDQFDSDNSNIVQLFSLLKKDDRSKQMVYYQSGIGTYTSPQIATPFMSKIYKTVDVMIAWDLDAHVMAGYEFLMQNYHAGDRICIFGFSRGAYTARSLAGMIHKVGLLPADNWQQVPFAYKMYTRTDKVGWDQSTAFKQAFSNDVQIEFLGVWDTVDSVGLIPKRLPFTTSNTILRTFRHAVSLDERRAKFKANLWNRPSVRELLLGTSRWTTQSSHQSDPSPSSTLKTHTGEHKEQKESEIEWSPQEEKFMNEMERLHSSSSGKPTDIEEVWFAGCHCDVGGGSVNNSTRYSLARISLRWMIRECFKTKTGIMFDSQQLRLLGLDPTTLHPFVTPRPPALSVDSVMMIRTGPPKPPLKQKLVSAFRRRTLPSDTPVPVDEAHANALLEEYRPIGTEEEEELRDALSPIYDQLKRSRSWWILEVIPMEFRHQKGDDKWVSWFGPNLARPRIIPKQSSGVKVHRSVRMRMEAFHEHKPQKKYKPKANLKVTPTWVDDHAPEQQN